MYQAFLISYREYNFNRSIIFRIHSNKDQLIMKNYFYFAAVLFSGLIFGQSSSNINTLEKMGLENLAEVSKLDHYYFTYENNRYRYEGDALIAVLKNIEVAKMYNKVSILIQNRGIGISAVSFNRDDLIALKEGKIEPRIFADKADFTFQVDALNQIFDAAKRTNSSYLKGEVIVGLDLRYALGNFDNAVRQKLNFQPELFSVLGKGAVVSGRYNIPSFNEIDDDVNRLELARFTQDIRFKDNVFLNMNFGFFTLNRYGITTRIDRYLGSERLKLRFDFGMTRSLYLDENFDIVIRNNLNVFNMAGGLVYRWNKFDTDIAYQYGTFLFGDTGYKASLRRQFDEVFVGLFMNKTTFGTIAGFDFRIPLSIKRHMKNSGVRIRSKDFFYLDYNYRYDSNVAVDYFTGSNVLTQIQEYYPEVLRKKVAKQLW